MSWEQIDTNRRKRYPERIVADYLRMAVVSRFTHTPFRVFLLKYG